MAEEGASQDQVEVEARSLRPRLATPDPLDPQLHVRALEDAVAGRWPAPRSSIRFLLEERRRMVMLLSGAEHRTDPESVRHGAFLVKEMRLTKACLAVEDLAKDHWEEQELAGTADGAQIHITVDVPGRRGRLAVRFGAAPQWEAID